MSILEVPVLAQRDGDFEVSERTTSYHLLDFPFEPYRLLGGRDQLGDDEAETYVEWMNDVEPRRSSYAMEMFLACGAERAPMENGSL